jgi:ribosome-associated toxin RatA of RatAB toxin-antitoxin module/CRP-like cAMP-binding protein
VLVPYSVEDMFDLIEQAEHYPKFLPWCVGAQIFERSDEWVAAKIEFSYLQVRFGFQTRNPKRRPQWLQVRLVEGPFRHFQADWHLTPLGNQGCKVNFDLSYEISDGLLDRIAVPAVDLVSRSMMDAFVKRAEATLNMLSLTAPVPATVFVAAVPRSTPEPEPEVAPMPAPSAEPATPFTATENTMTAIDPALYQAVQTCPLAQDLSPDQIAVLAGLLSLESVAPDQVLAREGTADNHLYMVVEGSLAVIRSLGTDEQSPIATLCAGDFAHELGFLDGSVRYASLVAATASRVLVLEREKLETLIDSHPLILYRVMCAIVRTVHRVQTRLAMQAAELTNYVFKQHGRY